MPELNDHDLAAGRVTWCKSRFSGRGDASACIEYTTASVDERTGQVTKDVEGVPVVLGQVAPPVPSPSSSPPPMVRPPAPAPAPPASPFAATGTRRPAGTGSAPAWRGPELFLDDPVTPSSSAQEAQPVAETPSIAEQLPEQVASQVPEPPAAAREAAQEPPASPVATPQEAPVTTGGGADTGAGAVQRRIVGGAPAGIGWTQARLAHAWNLEFRTADPGPLYAALLDAWGGSITLPERVVREAAELGRTLGERLRALDPAEGLRRMPGLADAYREAALAGLASAPTGSAGDWNAQIQDHIDSGHAWEALVGSVSNPEAWPDLHARAVPVVMAEQLGASLLVLRADGGVASYGSGDVRVLAETVSPDGTRSWAGLAPAAGVPALGALSAAQVRWAADAGMAFVGRRDGGGFVGALLAAGRASGAAVPATPSRELRAEFARRIEDDTALIGSPDWERVAAGYVAARPHVAMSDLASEQAAGEAWREIVAAIRVPMSDEALAARVLPALVPRYFDLGVRVLHADGGTAIYGREPAVTVAQVSDSGETLFVGAAPVAAPRSMGAGTRPAQVAGGWAGESPAAPSGATRETPAATAPPAVPLEAAGPVPQGMTAAQREWAWRNRRRIVEVPPGPDAFFEAVLRSSGGFTVDGVFVRDTAQLRELLADRIERSTDRDPATWLTVLTVWAARAPGRNLLGLENGPADEAEARAVAAVVADWIDGGEALPDILRAIREPEYWPELAEEVAPYFLNLFGRAVRTVDADGAVGRYGRGRPVYVAPLAGDGPRRWAALPPALTRYTVGSRLDAPNLSDPVAVRLGQAIGAGASTADAAQWLRGVRGRWLALVDGTPAPDSGPAAPPELDPARLETLVSGLDRGQTGVAVPELGVAQAVQLIEALFPPDLGGVRPAPAPGSPATQAGPSAGLSAEQWTRAPSLRELIRAVPAGGAALFLDGDRTWMVAGTAQGRRLVEFRQDGPVVIDPLRTPVTETGGPGLALVIGPDGQVIPAELEGFTSAVGWDTDLLTAGGAATAGSDRQNALARDYDARLEPARPGADSFFEAAVTAAGGALTVGDAEVRDAAGLRGLLAERLRTLAGDGGLGRFVEAAFWAKAPERIVLEFLGNDPSRLDWPAVGNRVRELLESGSAFAHVEQAITRPGHWEAITQQVAPGLLAAAAGLNLLVVDRDGRVHEYGAPDGRRLVLARTGDGSAGQYGWAAVVPGPGASDRLGEIVADTGGAPPERVVEGVAAPLNEQQRAFAESQGLRQEPVQAEAGSLLGAVLAATGGLMLNDVYIATPVALRNALTDLLRSRPDVLDDTALPVRDTEQVIDLLHDPARSDEVMLALAGPYLGLGLRVVEPTGEVVHGTGREVTVAPTSQDGRTQWAALVPNTTVFNTHLTEALPYRGATDQPFSLLHWSPQDFTLQPPGTDPEEGAWQESTFCLVNDGVMTCVSVAVVTLGDGIPG